MFLHFSGVEKTAGLTVLFLLFAFLAVGYRLASLVIKPKRMTYEESLAHELERGRLTKKDFSLLPKEELYIESPQGYPLHGFFIEAEGSNRVVLLNHGITQTLIGTLKFVELYKKNGFHILLHDFRYHGKSGGRNSTFGFQEKEDIKAWIDWLKRREPSLEIIGIHGESLGATIGIEAAASDERIDFVIADCAFSSWKDILIYRLKWDFHLPIFPTLLLTELWIKLRTGAWLQDVQPEDVLETMETPIFFIHGTADKYTPAEMSKRMFEKKGGKKRLWLVPDARHTGSYELKREEYEREVTDFLTEIGVITDENGQ